MKNMNARRIAALRQVDKGIVTMVRNSNPRGTRTRDAVVYGGGKINLQMDFLLENGLAEVVTGLMDYAPREVKLTKRGERILALYAM